MFKTLVLIFIGGGFGAMARFLTGKGVALLLAKWTKQDATEYFVYESFPLGTLLSNLLACAIMGLVIYLTVREQLSASLTPLFIIGFCGGYSTFSTFSYESLGLIMAGKWYLAILNILISITACIFVLFVVAKQLR